MENKLFHRKMSLLNGCVSNPEVDSCNWRKLEDDEAQLQSIFSEAILLKKRVRVLNQSLSEHEMEAQRLHKMIRQRDNVILQMEVEREDDYSKKLKDLKVKEVESTQAMLDMKRQLNNAVNEAEIANTVIQGMSSRIKALELKAQERAPRDTADANTQTEPGRDYLSQMNQLYALRASTKKLIEAVKRLSTKGNKLPVVAV